MDLLSLAGGGAFIIIGFLGLFRDDLLWRLYSLERRWREEHPEQPKNWASLAKRQGYAFVGVGILFILMGVIIGGAG
ncbi:MAG: hypothetical protein ACPG7F_05485 [Aggregatilineales bacterium]